MITNLTHVTEPEPARATLLPAAPGIHRIVARNPGRMTYHGTNTWLVEHAGAVTIIDPGPDDATHVTDVVRLSPGPIAAIILTHTHADHLGATAALRAATAAPVYGWHASADPSFTPDIPLHDGDAVSGLGVLHTPGHASDHVCLARDDGVLFSGDHVMGWSTTVVSPPDGDMADYFTSLDRLLCRPDRLHLPGHGPPVPNPTSYVRALLTHRRLREAAIVQAVTDRPSTLAEIVACLYPRLDPVLLPAAGRSVLAHLRKLASDGRLCLDGDRWASVAD